VRRSTRDLKFGVFPSFVHSQEGEMVSFHLREGGREGGRDSEMIRSTRSRERGREGGREGGRTWKNLAFFMSAWACLSLGR